MAATVQNIYDSICFDLLEDGGLVLGLLTEQQFIDILNLVIIEFAKEAGINLDIFTQTVSAGTGQYSIPNTTMRVDEAFLAGVRLEQSDVEDINNQFQRWRYDFGPPTSLWHSDELPPQTIELVLKPNYNGSFIRGASFPAPPNGVYGSVANDGFSASVETSPGVFTIQNPQQHGDLTTVGPQYPTLVAALGDPLPWADDIALGYLAFGVLERVFCGDNELKDPQRALWCGAQFREGIAIFAGICGEPTDD